LVEEVKELFFSILEEEEKTSSRKIVRAGTMVAWWGSRSIPKWPFWRFAHGKSTAVAYRRREGEMIGCGRREWSSGR